MDSQDGRQMQQRTDAGCLEIVEDMTAFGSESQVSLLMSKWGEVLWEMPQLEELGFRPTVELPWDQKLSVSFIKYCSISTKCSGGVTCYTNCSSVEVFIGQLLLLHDVQVFKGFMAIPVYTLLFKI